MKDCVIIDYASGNLHSAAKSFERMARETNYSGRIVVSADADQIRAADRIVLPGVGAFADCRAGLDNIPGLVDILRERVIDAGVPFLGICVGEQLMASIGREHGADCPGFGWIPGEVVAIEPEDPNLKIPHMGWNTLEILSPHPVLDGITSEADAYFVHSYHLKPEDAAHCVAQSNHGGPITAAIARDNMIGTQFHPEKSQKTGLRLIGNFLHWAP